VFALLRQLEEEGLTSEAESEKRGQLLGEDDSL
jgi:hypothetical protein